MQVKDSMRLQVTTVTPETLVSTAYQLMTLRKIEFSPPRGDAAEHPGGNVHRS